MMNKDISPHIFGSIELSNNSRLSLNLSSSDEVKETFDEFLAREELTYKVYYKLKERDTVDIQKAMRVFHSFK